MAGMARTALVAAMFILLMLPSGALAVSICDFTSIPQYPSFNSSMLLIIPTSEVAFRMGALTPPVKVSYEARDPYTFGTIHPWSWGAMQKFGGCYVCEFSGSSSFDASCGPTPFTYAGSFNMDFFANNFNKEVYFNRTGTPMLIYPDYFRGILIDIGEDGSVQVAADPPTVPMTEVWMNIYDVSTGLRSNASGSMNATDFGKYIKEVKGLKPGTYYADFGFRTAEGKTGGELRKFTISPVSSFTLELDKASYWIGGKMQVTGLSCHPKVTLKVTLPDRTLTVGEKNVVDGKYDFEFPIDKTYPKGNYTLKVEYGTYIVEKIVEVNELFTLSKTAHTFTFTDASTRLSENITVRNMINGNITLTASASSDLTGFITPTLAKTGLGSFTTTTLTLLANPTGLPSAGKSGKVTVSTSDGVAISMDVSLISNTVCPQCPPASGPAIEISPALWKETGCVSGGTVNETFSIVNKGATALSTFSLTSSDFTVIGKDFPSSIAAGGSGSAEISLDADEGVQSGYLEVSSGSSRARIYVVTSCADDSSSDVEYLKDELDSLSENFLSKGFSDDKVSEMVSGVDYDLKAAESYIGSGDYAGAARSLSKAQAGYDALSSAYESIGSGGSGDGGLLVMLLSVALVVVLGILFYMMFGAKLLKGKPAAGGEEGSAQQAEEELF